MKILHCEDVEDLCLNIIEKIECLIGEYGTISILAKYEIAKEIISELSAYRTLISIELHDPEYESYYDEYLIILDDEGILCMPAKIDGKYLQDDPTILYVHQDCNSKALSKIKGKINVEFTCRDMDCDAEDYYDNEELECDVDYELLADETSNMHGFTYSKTEDNRTQITSFYSTESLSDDYIIELLRELSGVVNSIC